MSDRHMYEFEGVVWDESGDSGDHIVPHPGDKHLHECALDGELRKKSWQKVVTPITKTVDKNYAGQEETSFWPLKNRRDPMLEKVSWSHKPEGVFSASCDSDSMKEVSTLASDETRISSRCFKTSNLESIDNEFCEDDLVLSDSCAAVDNLCLFPVGQFSHADNNLDLFSNGQDKESSDFLYYDWPDIGNFEDVDKMFRSCDSTFGEGNGNNSCDFSWISCSSHAFDGSEDALKSGFISSCSESNALKNTLEYDEDDLEYMTTLVYPSTNDSDIKSSLDMHRINSRMLDVDELVDVGHSSYASWDDAEAETKGEFTSKEQPHDTKGEVEAKILPVTQTSDIQMINLQRENSKCTNQSERKRKDQHPKYLNRVSSGGPGTIKQSRKVNLSPSVPSAKQVFLSPGIRQQKRNLGSESCYFRTYVSNANPGFSNQSNQIPLTPESSISRSENNVHLSISSKESSYASSNVQHMEKSTTSSPKAPAMIMDKKFVGFCQQQDAQETLYADPQHMASAVKAASAGQYPDQKQLHQIQNAGGCDGEVEEVILDLHGAHADSSIVHGSSCISSNLDEISLKAISFRQLQCAMEQLDVRTKLCIRDSLYRLARSAEKRNSFGHLNCGSRDSRERNGLLTAEESHKCTGFMDMETNTNPIDRSIAHLLFHRPLDRSMMPANDALSVESHAKIHGSATCPPVISEKLVCQEKIVGGSDTKLLISDH